MSADIPNVSVVICTYNRDRTLGAALESAAAQQVGGEFEFEIVVIDDGSTDSTPEVVRRAAASSAVPVRYIRESGRGVPFARNRGVAEAAGEWVAFFDDDQIAGPGWLAELMRVAHERGADVVGGLRLLEFEARPPFRLGPLTRAILGEKDHGTRPCRSNRNTLACTGNVLVRRDVFNHIGGFDTAMTQGMSDIDFTRRALDASIESWYAPGAVVQHVIPPHRLGEGYLRWTCLRVGTNHSLINYKSRGISEMLLRAMVRAGHAMTLNLLLAALARLARQPGAILERQCYRWMAEGSVRMALHLALPGVFSQERFLGPLAFRGERRTFGRER